MPTPTGTVTVTGVVQDRASRKGITGLAVDFAGDQGTVTAMTGDTARYSVELLPGTYRVDCELRDVGMCVSHGGGGGSPLTVTVDRSGELDLDIVPGRPAPAPSPDPSRSPAAGGDCTSTPVSADDVRGMLFGDSQVAWCGGSGTITIDAAFIGGSPPCSQVSVYVYRSDNQVALAGLTGDDGVFQASGLPAGTYIVMNPSIGGHDALPLVNGTEATQAQVTLPDGGSASVPFACN